MLNTDWGKIFNTQFSSSQSLSEHESRKPFHIGTIFYAINPSVMEPFPRKAGSCYRFPTPCCHLVGMSPNPRSLNPRLTTPVFTILVPSKIRVVLAGEGRRAARQGREGGRGTTAKLLLNVWLRNTGAGLSLEQKQLSSLGITSLCTCV